MTRYLLDTNCWITFLKQPDSPLGVRIESTPASSIMTCSIVLAELMHGAEKYGNRDRRMALVTSTLAPYQSLSFDDGAAIHFASIRHELETKGTPIGPYDLQIAAIARANKLTVVTNNLREFGRVPGLDAEDWTAQ